MMQCFTNLMDGIDRTLLTKNRDRLCDVVCHCRTRTEFTDKYASKEERKYQVQL